MLESEQKHEVKKSNLESKLREIGSGTLLCATGAILGYATIESVPYVQDFVESNVLNNYLLARPHRDAIISLSSYFPALLSGLASFGLMCCGAEQFSKKKQDDENIVKFNKKDKFNKYNL